MKTHYKVHLEGSGVIASCAFAAHAVMIHAQYARATIKWSGITLLKKGEHVERPTDLMEKRRINKLDQRAAEWEASQARAAAARTASPDTLSPPDMPFSS